MSALTPARARGAATTKTPTPVKISGTDDAALAELRNAAATYEFLRGKGDPAQFWEMLRLARDRRAIVAPREGAAPAPAPQAEAAIVHELGVIRKKFSPMVRKLRRYLQDVPGLPEPFDRFEMALAFLLASTREHQAIEKWLLETGKHEAKAAEKLRSLAAITDPYREALKPWVLQGGIVDDGPEGPDLKLLESVRRAVQCRVVLSGYKLETDLWETMLLTTAESESTETALQTLTRNLGGETLEKGKALERLREAVSDVRQMYADWVQAVRGLPDMKSRPSTWASASSW